MVLTKGKMISLSTVAIEVYGIYRKSILPKSTHPSVVPYFLPSNHPSILPPHTDYLFLSNIGETILNMTQLIL